MIEKSREKFKYLENEENCSGETKNIFHQFYRAFSCQNCLRHESAPLISISYLYPEKQKL